MPRAKCGFDDVAEGPSGKQLLVLHGPSLLVDIGFDGQFQPMRGAIPRPSAQGVWALVDTGATESCIDGKLAAELALPVIDRRHIAGVGGLKEVHVHLAQIHVPSLSFTIYGQFAGVDLAAGGQQHRALIGRTFLQRFTMIYTGSTGDVEIYS
jgi:predicted aspartyl protease